MQGFFRNPFGSLARDAGWLGLARPALARCSSATGAPLRGATLGIALLASSLALLTLPACNECDSSIDPVKCTDLCTQSPPHEDCAKCQGDSPARGCPQCLVDEPPASCTEDGGGSGGEGGTVSGNGGTGGNAGTVSGSGGSGGNAGVVTGGEGGTSSGSGGTAGSDVDAGPPPSCDEDTDCTEAARPLCSEGECAPCETNAVCLMHHEPLVRCSNVGACVECRNDDDCGDNATPNCVAGRCEECEIHGDCNSNPAKPQCNSARDCVACTETGNACAEHGTLMCDARADDATETEGQCVECLEHGDCPDEAPQCNAAGACVKCDGTLGDDPCTGRMDGDISIAKCSLRDDVSTFGECVECTGDTLTDPPSDVCGVNPSAYSCNQQIGRCTGRLVGSRARCRSCAADSECNMGGKCVEHIIDPTVLGTFCFYPIADDDECAGPGNLDANPFSVDLVGDSVDLYNSKYCLPPTTCDAYLDAVNVTLCGPTVACGTAGIPDGICTDVGAVSDQCTYACDSPYECPERLPVCDAIGGFCRLE